jgi:hypothetical protein
MQESSAMTIMRYAILITLAIASLYAVINASAESGQRFLVDAGQSGAAPQDLYLWVLAGIAIVTSLSLYRFVVFGIPTLLGGWYSSNKQWLGTLLLLALMWGVFYLMRQNVSETGEPWQGSSVADPTSYGGNVESGSKVE